MCEHAEYAECESQQGKSRYPEEWMKICDNCGYIKKMLENYKGEVYGVLCGLNGTGRDSYEIYIEAEIPENCPQKREKQC